MAVKKHDFQMLNLRDLDVEELERRLEMAASPVTPDGWYCDCNGHCDFVCNDYTIASQVS